jgi:hypothetical protein
VSNGASVRYAVRVCLRLAMIAVLAACGDNATETSVPQSGSRLRLVTYVYTDGAREWDPQVFFDRALAARCSIRLFSDGARYCMPEQAGGRTVFVNATCSRAVGTVAPDAAAPPYFIRYFSLGGDSTPSRVYRAHAATAAPLEVWFQLGTECTGPYPADPALVYHELGEELALVRVRESERITGQRLAMMIDTSDDGLRVPRMLVDRDLELPCEVAASPYADAAACVPLGLPRADYYADAGCSEPLAALATGAPELATHHGPLTGCHALYRVAATAEPAAVYEILGGACVMVPRPAGTLYALGEGVPPTSAARVHTGTTSRLAPIELVDDSVRWPDGFVFDRLLAGECRRRSREDSIVCEPHATARVQEFFADPACTTLVRLAVAAVGACQPPPRFASDGEAIHEVGDVLEVALFELEPGDRCGDYTLPVHLQAYTLGAPLDRATFAHATLVID